MRFRLAPNLSTLDDPERPKRPLAEVNKNSGDHQKNFNEDRPISLAGNCRLLSRVSRNIMHLRIFVWVSRGGAVKRQCGFGSLPFLA